MANALMGELEAVNIMFTTIGEAPLNDLAGQHPHLSIARNILSQQMKELLAEGWSFNSEENIEITVNGSNQFVIPTNVLMIEPYDLQYKKKITRRKNGSNHMLYDIENQTFDFSTRGLSKLKVNRIFAFDFDELPYSFCNYVAKEASARFAYKMLGNSTTSQFAKAEAFEAKKVFLAEESDRANHNMLTDNNNINYMRYPAWV